MPETAHAGGSFAPPIDAETLEYYRELAGGAHPRVADAMEGLLEMADLYLAAPAPKKGAKAAKADAGKPHPSGLGSVHSLPKEEVDRLWDAVPWQEEVEMLGKVFDRIDPAKDKALRDAAFHMLWLAQELTLDRRPITSDQVKDQVEAAAAEAGYEIKAGARFTPPRRPKSK
jgi:hypothetical protein